MEQNAGVALGIADYGYVLENGRVVLEGPPPSCAAGAKSSSPISARRSGEERRSYRALRPAPAEGHPHG